MKLTGVRNGSVQIMKKFRVPPFDQHLICDGRDLSDNQASLAALGIYPGTVIYLQVRKSDRQWSNKRIIQIRLPVRVLISLIFVVGETRVVCVSTWFLLKSIIFAHSKDYVMKMRWNKYSAIWFKKKTPVAKFLEWEEPLNGKTKKKSNFSPVGTRSLILILWYVVAKYFWV